MQKLHQKEISEENMEWIVVVVHTFISELLYQRYGMAHKKMYVRLIMAVLIGTFVLWNQKEILPVALSVVLMYIAIIDYFIQKIPNTMVMYLFVVKLSDVIFRQENWSDATIAFLLFLLVMSLLYRFSKGGLGAGDVKLVAVVAFYLGLEQTCLVLMIACGLIVFYALVRWLFKQFHWKSSVPMAPFLLVGYIVHSVILFGGLS